MNDTIVIKHINHTLKNDIGYIRLSKGIHHEEVPFKAPFLEYGITNLSFRNQGIMSRELPVFLEEIKDNFPIILAQVLKDNIHSIKLLEKNGFSKIFDKRNVLVYIIDFEISKDEMLKCFEEFKKTFSYSNFSNS